jgi:hypothetical protein
MRQPLSRFALSLTLDSLRESCVGRPQLRGGAALARVHSRQPRQVQSSLVNEPVMESC